MLRSLLSLSSPSLRAQNPTPSHLLDLSAQLLKRSGCRDYINTSYSTEAAPRSTLQICVVGSGPSGFYAVSQLLKSFGQDIRISLLERLPTPYGLVRSGVAPDHPETKNVINQFAQLGCDSRVSFLGNVHVGHDITLSTLRTLYDGVVLAYGAESTKTLDIPGRHSEGVFTAREFVWWYNGHPEYSSLPIDLSQVKRVSILGLGNVALDCARILLQPVQRLKSTDIASHALRQLEASSLTQVDVIGRRGPAQAAFTAKELRELLNMDGINVVMPKEDMVISDIDRAELKASRARKRVFDLLSKAGEDKLEGDSQKVLRMRFLRSPVEIVPGEFGRVTGLRLEKMKLKDRGPKQVATPTGMIEEIPADMVLESIGYKSLPLAGAPFDEQTGTVPNSMPAVKDGSTAWKGPLTLACTSVGGSNADRQGSSATIKSRLVWQKSASAVHAKLLREATETGTNLNDAQETVRAMCEDVQSGALQLNSSGTIASQALKTQLEQKGVKVVTFEDWQKIDAAERTQGELEGRERDKFISIDAMLQCATT